MPSRQDWLLLLLALRDANEPLDATRLQSGMFLLSREGGLPEAAVYEFKPYEPGPFSTSIFSDVAGLEEEQLVAREQVAGDRWSEFRITDVGLAKARSLLGDLDEVEVAALHALGRIKADVLSKSFRDLLDYVNTNYPEFARNSIFR